MAMYILTCYIYIYIMYIYDNVYAHFIAPDHSVRDTLFWELLWACYFGRKLITLLNQSYEGEKLTAFD